MQWGQEEEREMWNRRHRWIKRFAAGLAFAAIVTPAAQASVAGEGGGVSGKQFVYHAGYAGGPLAAYGYQQQGTIVRPDDRSSRFVPQTSDQGVVLRPDDRASRFTPQVPNERLQLRRDPGAGSAPTISVPEQPQAVASNDFDWGDAAVGAGVAVGLMLIALGGVLIVRRTGTKSLAGA
ncbi:MAG TPA: hypothetical protein VH306_00955 [Gaiellaceae bacterium]|jgi:hypothetical protein